MPIGIPMMWRTSMGTVQGAAEGEPQDAERAGEAQAPPPALAAIGLEHAPAVLAEQRPVGVRCSERTRRSRGAALRPMRARADMGAASRAMLCAGSEEPQALLKARASCRCGAT